MRKDGKKKHLGVFDCESEAAEAYDSAAGPLGKGVNFPEPSQEQAIKRGAHGIFSKCVGVSWHVGTKKWQVRVHKDGKSVHLGYFASEKAAARQYDQEAAEPGYLLNFPSRGQAQAIKGGSSRYDGVDWHQSSQLWEARGLEHGTFVPLGFFATEDEAARAVAAHHDSFSTKISQYVGVTRHRRMEKWQALIDIGGTKKHLGVFDSEAEAARAYDAAAGPLGRALNLPTEREVH